MTCSLKNFLLQGDEARRVGSTDTGTSVANGLVGQGELAQVVADHLTLDLNGVEVLTVVDTDDGSNHLGEDEGITQVRLDGLGLLTDLGLLLGGTELLHQSLGLLLDTAVHASAGTSVDHLGDLGVVQLQKLLQLLATVGELVEGALLLQLLIAFTVDGGHLVCVYVYILYQ